VPYLFGSSILCSKNELPFVPPILIIFLQSIPQLLIISMVVRDAQSIGLMFLLRQEGKFKTIMGSIDSLISVSFLLLRHDPFKIELPFVPPILIISLQSIPQLLIVLVVLRDAQSTGLMFLFKDRKVNSRQ
jgi:hypothetical protein